uniref:SGNH hydrolase-type esterase domain-containing protein n=1 Tax=Haptolina brevifila TaxID=156173 RepID=A0A7S2JGA1_9EUKA
MTDAPVPPLDASSLLSTLSPTLSITTLPQPVVADRLIPTAKRRILCYGDSLTAGYITESPYTRKYAPWAPVLAEAVGVPCDAVGASGWTTRDMVKHSDGGNRDACGEYRKGLCACLAERAYSTVIIMGGTNDLGTSSADEISSRLLTLHGQCHAAGCRTVALTIPQGRQIGPWTGVT